MSGETGFEPTRNRPRSASPSGVVVRASIARIRSHGLSTPLPHRRVEDAAARDLEAREPGAVEDLRDAEHVARRDAPGERLLRQEPDRRVVELRHAPHLSACSAPALTRDAAAEGNRHGLARRGTVGHTLADTVGAPGVGGGLGWDPRRHRRAASSRRHGCRFQAREM